MDKPSTMGEGSAEMEVERGPETNPRRLPWLDLPSASIREPNLFLTHGHQQRPLSPFTQDGEERLQSCRTSAGSRGQRGWQDGQGRGATLTRPLRHR